MRPLAIDLYCGLGGWTEGLLAEGYTVIGFDIERHHYGEAKYPAQLVLQDVLTIHGAQFKDAALIVASPPCQAYSYRAMPWKRAKALPPPSNALFEACFRIQAEAIDAAGHFIPLVVENVRGAQPYVGRAKWHHGSFYLWGDVPALMPITRRAIKGHGGAWLKDAETADGTYGAGNFRIGVDGATKNAGGSWFNIGSPGQTETNRNPVHEFIKAQAFNGTAEQRWRDGVKKVDNGYTGMSGWGNGHTWSKSSARKAASAHIAKIPLPLARWIARAWYPHDEQEKQNDCIAVL